jgi:hypothetical protein
VFSPLEGHLILSEGYMLPWATTLLACVGDLKDTSTGCLDTGTFAGLFCLRTVLQGYVFSLSSTASGIAQ